MTDTSGAAASSHEGDPFKNVSISSNEDFGGKKHDAPDTRPSSVREAMYVFFSSVDTTGGNAASAQGPGTSRATDWNEENETPKHTKMRKQGIPFPSETLDDSFRTKEMVLQRGIPWHEDVVSSMHRDLWNQCNNLNIDKYSKEQHSVIDTMNRLDAEEL